MARNCKTSVIAMQIRHGGVEDRCLSRGVAAFIDFAAEAKLVRFESAGTFALHTFPFGFNPGGATGTQGIGVGSVEVCS